MKSKIAVIDRKGIIKLFNCNEFEDNIESIKVTFYLKDGSEYTNRFNSFSEEGNATFEVDSVSELNESDFLSKIKSQTFTIKLTWPGDGLGLY